MFRAWLEIARISNLPTVWTNVTAAWLLAGGPWQDVRLLWLLLGGSLLYTAGMILNDVADAGYDNKHKKTRPIPSGRISLPAAWVAGGVMMLAGVLVSTDLGGASGRLTLVLAAAILIYDMYHKPWPGSIWVMGICRALLYVVAATSVSSFSEMLTMSNGVIAGAAAMGGYVVGLTQVARTEAKGGAIFALQNLLGRLLLFTPAIIGLAFWLPRANWKLITLLGDLTPLVPGVFILLFIGMVIYAIRVMRRGGPAIGEAVGILLAGIAIVDALAVMQVSPSLACVFVAVAPILRLWQRWIAAT